ncbi:MAG: beta-propeller fold lactonase family protein [Acidobacteriota bacterium]
MPVRLYNKVVASLLCLSLLNLNLAFAQSKASQRRLPGKIAAGMLLPNGWTLTPEGQQIPISDLPLNMVLSKDGRYLLVTTNGNGDQTINVIDLQTNASVQNITVRKSWLGLDFAPDGKRFYVSGGDDNEVMVYDFAGGKATAAGKINLGSAAYHKLDDRGRAEARRNNKGEYAFPAGIAVAPDGKRLYVAENLANKIAVVDLSNNQVITKIEVGEYPYDCLVSNDGKRVYVSNWGSRSIAVIDPASNSVTGNIQVGDHPNDLELTRDGKTLYVANANSNTVSVVDTGQMKEIEAISTALHPKSPAGSTPNAVALSPDEKTLYVANADNNDIAIVDVASRKDGRGKSEVEGFIPTGWYPTSVRTSKDGRRIFVANGKGVASAANPKGPNPYKVRGAETEYIGSLLKGTVSLINKPAKAKLSLLTRQTYKNSPYTDELLKAAKAPREKTAIPFRIGAQSPIKHVIYVIKENRTYDQILGDMKEGNGDASICLFGEDVTPNHHAIACEFVLLDNFYVDAEVSADGHNWSTAAYATDYTEKTWPTNYSGRGRSYDYEGSKKIARPTMGYIWDHCKRAGVSYRSYGEFIGSREGKPGGGGELGGDPGKAAKVNYTNEAALEGHFSPTFPSWDLTIPDNVRVEAWLKEFRDYEQNGQLPQFQIVRLGGDHTQGTRAGAPTPRAHVAENDLAVGRMVEAVSASERYWKDTAVFIIEDDAQNGPDHVDAHRSTAYVASAYTKRGYVDSTMYTTSGMLRTMELILGVPPMSQYDAAATPMFNSFTDKANLTPFKHRPARIDLNEKNTARSPGADRSAQLDFTKEDAAPDIEFNEIIWRAVKGEQSQMPAPVRSAFVRAVADDDDDEKDREKEERRDVRRKAGRKR